jgi:nitroimidazol reductase NimA-like FMN-containing flavoprotein (pyridoxamine 5'-phosphate oxidase superfamily)
MLGNLNDEQMDYLLRSQLVGRLGCSANGQVYIVPVTYVYDGQYIYGHTKEGQKVRMMRENPSVCFQVDAIQNMANWQTVIVQGHYEELSGEESQQAIRLLTNRASPFIISETSVAATGFNIHLPTGSYRAVPVTYRIRITDKSGRFEKR